MKKLFIKNLMALSLVVISLTACTRLPGTPDIQEVSAARKNIDAVALRSFAPQNVRLSNNKLFLWKENRTEADVATAIRVSNKLEELDDEAYPLNKRQLELGNQIDPYDQKLRDLTKQISKINTALSKAQKDKTSKTKDLNTAQASLNAELAKSAETQNAALITQLNNQIQTLTSQISALDAQMTQNQSDLAPLKSQKSDVEAQVAPLKQERDSLDLKQAEISKEGEDQVSNITQAVDWYKDQPSAISFQFTPDGISAEIRDWNLKILNADDNGETPQSYSTDRGSIQDVTYKEQGGEFKMNVYVYKDSSSDGEPQTLQSSAQSLIDITNATDMSQASQSLVKILDSASITTSVKLTSALQEARAKIESQTTLGGVQTVAAQVRASILERLKDSEILREIYRFTIRRARYDLLDRDGRVCFGGEFQRLTLNDGKVRKGMLKLIEGNNK